VNTTTRNVLRRGALLMAVLASLAAPHGALAQALSPADPAFWVILPSGARVPYNHPLATGAPAADVPTTSPQPVTVSPQVPAGRVLSTSDPGFWVTLPGGAVVPYNHPLAIAQSSGPDAPVVPPTTVPVTGVPTTTPTAGPVLFAGLQMRVLQWNLHHGVGTDGTYDLNRLATWMAAMKPDVVMLNEVEKNTSWGNEEFGDWNADGKGHLILSTYPIESTDRTVISYSRVISQARIVVNGRSISLISTHLDPDSAVRRLTQAQEVTRWAATQPENRILAGDMNAWPDQTSISEYNVAYHDSWAIAASKGAAYGFSGLAPDGATKNGRIDYILYSKTASDLLVVDSRVYDTRDSNGVTPSDHRPVLTTFQVR
jgi:endonuclease/exonuclease/phosphatase family metal-dependent hydrolase